MSSDTVPKSWWFDLSDSEVESCWVWFLEDRGLSFFRDRFDEWALKDVALSGRDAGKREWLSRVGSAEVRSLKDFLFRTARLLAKHRRAYLSSVGESLLSALELTESELSLLKSKRDEFSSGDDWKAFVEFSRLLGSHIDRLAKLLKEIGPDLKLNVESVDQSVNLTQVNELVLERLSDFASEKGVLQSDGKLLLDWPELSGLVKKKRLKKGRKVVVE